MAPSWWCWQLCVHASRLGWNRTKLCSSQCSLSQLLLPQSSMQSPGEAKMSWLTSSRNPLPACNQSFPSDIYDLAVKPTIVNSTPSAQATAATHIQPSGTWTDLEVFGSQDKERQNGNDNDDQLTTYNRTYFNACLGQNLRCLPLNGHLSNSVSWRLYLSSMLKTSDTHTELLRLCSIGQALFLCNVVFFQTL